MPHLPPLYCSKGHCYAIDVAPDVTVSITLGGAFNLPLVAFENVYSHAPMLDHFYKFCKVIITGFLNSSFKLPA
jgi:hypothetical protein